MQLYATYLDKNGNPCQEKKGKALCVKVAGPKRTISELILFPARDACYLAFLLTGEEEHPVSIADFLGYSIEEDAERISVGYFQTWSKEYQVVFPLSKEIGSLDILFQGDDLDSFLRMMRKPYKALRKEGFSNRRAFERTYLPLLFYRVVQNPSGAIYLTDGDAYNLLDMSEKLRELEEAATGKEYEELRRKLLKNLLEHCFTQIAELQKKG